jgi:hypothetical protein
MTTTTTTICLLSSSSDDENNSKSLKVTNSSSDDDSDIPTESIFSSNKSRRNSRSSIHKSKDEVTHNVKNEHYPQGYKRPNSSSAHSHSGKSIIRQVVKEADGQTTKSSKRQTQAVERMQLRQSEQAEKLQRVTLSKQMNGKFSREEIGILLHSQFPRKWIEECHSKLTEVYPHVSESDTIHHGAVQFIRRDYIAGGAKAALQSLQAKESHGYQLIHRLLIIFWDPIEFLNLLQRSENEDDYPLLEEWLETIKTSWIANWNTSTSPRIMILLPGIMEALHRLWNQTTLENRTTLVTESELQDAIVWLHVAFCVECQILKSQDQILDVLLSMTRALSEEPYASQVTELECIRKIKSTVPYTAPPMDRARDAWIRMLQQIPRMSATRAEQVAQMYPTARSLWLAYQQNNVHDDGKIPNEHLVADIFGEKGQLKKLSEHLYRAMTSKDSKEVLF